MPGTCPSRCEHVLGHRVRVCAVVEDERGGGVGIGSGRVGHGIHHRNPARPASPRLSPGMIRARVPLQWTGGSLWARTTSTSKTIRAGRSVTASTSTDAASSPMVPRCTRARSSKRARTSNRAPRSLRARTSAAACGSSPTPSSARTPKSPRTRTSARAPRSDRARRSACAPSSARAPASRAGRSSATTPRSPTARRSPLTSGAAPGGLSGRQLVDPEPLPGAPGSRLRFPHGSIRRAQWPQRHVPAARQRRGQTPTGRRQSLERQSLER